MAGAPWLWWSRTGTGKYPVVGLLQSLPGGLGGIAPFSAATPFHIVPN
jgi:hypothetical protein